MPLLKDAADYISHRRSSYCGSQDTVQVNLKFKRTCMLLLTIWCVFQLLEKMAVSYKCKSIRNGNDLFPCVSAGMNLILAKSETNNCRKLPQIALVVSHISESLNDRRLYQRIYKLTKFCQSQARCTSCANDIFRVKKISSWDFLRWRRCQKRKSWKTYIKTRELGTPTFSFCKERFIPIWCFLQTTAPVALKFSMHLEVKLEMTALLLPLSCQKGWLYLDLLGKRRPDGKQTRWKVPWTSGK